MCKLQCLTRLQDSFRHVVNHADIVEHGLRLTGPEILDIVVSRDLFAELSRIASSEPQTDSLGKFPSTDLNK